MRKMMKKKAEIMISQTCRIKFNTYMEGKRRI